MKVFRKIPVISFAILFFFMSIFSGCSSSRTMRGGAIGSAAGGAIGGIIGSKSDDTAKGAILGAMIGGTAGALIGNYMDKQAAELSDELKNAEVERVGEGIKITFDSGILFDFDSDNLRTASKDNLRELAGTLAEYKDTNILIEGHTDSIGDDTYNEELSVERAESVSSYLRTIGIKRNRLITKGYGESQPVADNDTSEGRQKNRRVEVAIYANEELKEAAREGRL